MTEYFDWEIYKFPKKKKTEQINNTLSEIPKDVKVTYGQMSPKEGGRVTMVYQVAYMYLRRMVLYLEIDEKVATVIGSYSTKDKTLYQQVESVAQILNQIRCVMPLDFNVTHVIHKIPGYPPDIHHINS